MDFAKLRFLVDKLRLAVRSGEGVRVASVALDDFVREPETDEILVIVPPGCSVKVAHAVNA